MKTLKDIGESGWLARLKGEALTEAIGDDCAVISGGAAPKTTHTLITMDTLNEGVHFWRDKISAEDLGYKSLAVNLSDIAAMGGVPHSAFLSVSFTQDLSEEWLAQFLNGARGLLAQHNVKILGGDTNAAVHDNSVTWLLMGEAPASHTKLRSTAQAGDILAVTGDLGDSAAGLECLKKGFSQSSPRAVKAALSAHWRPRAHLEEGQFLAAQNGVRAMMDVSDGLYLDLPKLCELSQVGAKVELQKLPVSPALKTLSAEWNLEAQDLACVGGEDYVLLVSVAAESWDQVSIQFRNHFGRELNSIGRIEERGHGVKFFKNAQPFLSHKSFQHFK